MQAQIYLFDFKIYKDKDLLLFGYIQDNYKNWRKVELQVNEFKIDLKLNVDCNMFQRLTVDGITYNESQDMINYLSTQIKGFKALYKSFKQLDNKLPFKGANTLENNQQIVEFEFEDFKQYEQFGRKINELNEKLVQDFKNSTINVNDVYIDKLFIKETLHMNAFLKNEQSLYSEDSSRYNIISQMIDRYNKRLNVGKLFLESEILYYKNRNIPEYVECIQDLLVKYKFKAQMTKYPFRMMDDDSKSNYILKLIRQSKCQLAGYNKVNLTQIPAFNEDPTLRVQLECNSLDDIEYEESLVITSCPLTILAWDIEVCTESGKFDNDGKNGLNKVLCIGMSFGMVQATKCEQGRISTCITWVNSSDSQLSIEEFEDLYKSLMKSNKQYSELELQANRQYVIRVDSEVEMIKTFFRMVNLFDPSFITGFNDFQFDYPFIRDKISTFSVDNGVYSIIQLLYRGFITQKSYTFTQQNGQKKSVNGSYKGELFSSQSIKINASDQRGGICLDVMGIISIDTRILLMKTQKLEKKSLNDYLRANNLPIKLDVSFRDMNKAFKQLTQQNHQYSTQEWHSGQQTQNIQQQCSSIYEQSLYTQQYKESHNSQIVVNPLDIMRDVFKYCMYDSEACYLLWKKRNILQQAIEVSKLSYTPLKYSFLNADGIKVRNMVAKFAFDRNYCVPMTTKSQDIRIRDIEILIKYEKYPGAYVSPPKKGISTTPVSALDFESLYPSIIMAHNLSPEKVIEPNEIIPYNTKITKIEIPFSKGDQSEILSGSVLSRENEVGVYPSILKFLFDSRKKVKHAMESLLMQADNCIDIQEKQELEYQATLLNCKQLAIKVFMNTFYGETGNQKSPLFDVIISGGTTTLGQNYIKQVHKYIEEQDCEIVYGDSILGDEPLLLKDENGAIHIKTIESLIDEQQIQSYGQKKEQTQCKYLIWCTNNWIPVQRVIRHKINKNIYRVRTRNSIVDVTEDHSLIDDNFDQIKPQECVAFSTRILQSFPVKQPKSIIELDQSYQERLQLKGYLYNYYTSIPVSIINGDPQIKQCFMSGVIKSNRIKGIQCKSKLIAQQIFFLAQQIGFQPFVKYNKNNKLMVFIYRNNVQILDKVVSVQKIEVNKNQYVYDIETDLGMFNAGIGEMTLKNTDSVYFRPRFSHYQLYKQKKVLGQIRDNKDSKDQSYCSISHDLLASAYEATETLKTEINRRIGEQTGGFLRMAFEELLYPAMFTGKKKYCGVVYVPGKMDVKSKLTIKDILLRGIDFIKSQYPDIIKQVGYQTLINIMQYFMANCDQFKDNHIEQIFEDSYRDNLNIQLKDLIQKEILNLNKQLIEIKSDQYNQLSSKKKMRASKTGQMMLFKQRLVDIEDIRKNFIFSSLRDYVLQIDVQQLQQYGISIPEDGEILDLISTLQPSIIQKNVSILNADISLKQTLSQLNCIKSSDLINLTQFVQRKNTPINIQEYLKMYRTTASRILVSSFMDQSIDDPDQQEKQALKLSKEFYNKCSLQQQTNNIELSLTNPQLLQIYDKIKELGNILDTQTQIAADVVQKLQKQNQVNVKGLIHHIYKSVNASKQLKHLLKLIIQKDEVYIKLLFIQEQQSLQMDKNEYIVELVNSIQILLSSFRNFQVLPLLLKISYLLFIYSNDSDTVCTPQLYITKENIYQTLMHLIDNQTWLNEYKKVTSSIDNNGKLPPDMSESSVWLHKQRNTYIEKLKQKNKELNTNQQVVQLTQRLTRPKNIKKSKCIDDKDLIEELLLNSSKYIQEFFSDSIWDLNYQQYKKNPKQRDWFNQQMDLYRDNKLSQTKYVKLINTQLPDI